MNLSSKILTVILLIVFMLAFVGCNANEQVNYDYGVYIKSVNVEDGICTVHLTRNKTDHQVGNSVITVEIEQEGFFDRYTYNVNFDGNAIFSAVETLLQQDVTLLNGEEYSTLKIIYDYDTIYKSIKSDSQTLKVGDTYIHLFDVQKAPFNAIMTRAVANQSVWYGVAVSVAVAVVGVAITLTYIRGKYGR